MYVTILKFPPSHMSWENPSIYGEKRIYLKDLNLFAHGFDKFKM